jgi:hypothetical protein
MISEAKELLNAHGFARAVIVDDAFDDGPLPGDLSAQLWNTFFDDWTEEDEARIVADYNGADISEVEPLDLARDPNFVSALWRARAGIEAAGPLFEEFERSQTAKRAELVPLQELLEKDLALNCTTVGRSANDGLADAQLLFLDLFLGYVETKEAIDAAIARVRSVVQPRRDDPPIVILLSRSPQLQDFGPDVRDKAELLGCQFRMVRKSDLKDRPGMAERLYDLVRSRPDAVKLNSFINEWDKALLASREEFLRSIRTLDLADYANTQALTLEAEEEPLGDYVLDLFDIYLHNTLEGHADLVRAAKALNQINMSDYAPGQFMPPEEVVLMMDGAIFQNPVRTDTEADIDKDPKKVRLGDVFLAPPKKPQKPRGKAAKKVEGVAKPEPREVFAVLTQACDLQHGRATQLLMLKGSALPYAAETPPSKGQKTSVMRVDGVDYQVDWDLFSPETWRLSSIRRRITTGTRRIRRFRIHHALQLQQSFIGKLGRVGTLAELPARHAVGIRFYLRTKPGDAKLLVHRDRTQGAAVALVGRNDKGAPINWLLLAPELLDDFRQALTDVDGKDLPAGNAKIAEVRDDPQFYRLMKRGLPFNRQSVAGKRPFVEGKYAPIIEIFANGSIVSQDKIPTKNGPIVVEVEWG